MRADFTSDWACRQNKRGKEKANSSTILKRPPSPPSHPRTTHGSDAPHVVDVADLRGEGLLAVGPREDAATTGGETEGRVSWLTDLILPLIASPWVDFRDDGPRRAEALLWDGHLQQQQRRGAPEAR